MTFDEWLESDDVKDNDVLWMNKAIYAAEAAWNNRQALIDAHNERCEEECKDTPISECQVFQIFRAGRGNPLMCDTCPRRYMITEEG